MLFVRTVFKDRGNRAYAQRDYETAVKYYSEGLAELRDMQQLYTNRAQVTTCFHPLILRYGNEIE